MAQLMQNIVNPQLRRFFCVFAVTILLAFGGGMLCASRQSDEMVRLSTEEQLCYLDALADAMPEHADTIVAVFQELPADASVEDGAALLDDIGYRDMRDFPHIKQYYRTLRWHAAAYWLPLVCVLLLLLWLVGAGTFRSLFRQIRQLTEQSEAMLQQRTSGMEVRQAEGDLGTLASSLTRLSQRIQYLLDRLQQEKLFLRDFMLDISHQLKTPLTVLRLNHDLLCTGDAVPAAKQAEFLQADLQQLDRMEWLIAGQLKMARLEACAVAYTMEEQPLRETCTRAMAQFSALAKQREVVLRNQVPPSIFLLQDTAWLSEAISNLIKNALEHTTNGTITCQAVETPLSTQLLITDTGTGISKEKLSHLFDRFYNGGNTVNAQSVGIGLAIAKRIVEDHHGDLTMTSTPGQGTTAALVFLR